MNKILLFLFLCWMTPWAIPTVSGQQVMTLHDCMVYAVENSSKMKISREDISEARMARRQAILEVFTPNISAGTYANTNFGRTVDPETNTYKSLTSFNNGYMAGGSIMLFDGFSAVNNLRIKKTALKLGISQEQQTEDEICLATMEAYCNVLYCMEMTRVCDLFVKTARENHRLAVRQYELGQKSRADVVQAEADLADREFEQVNIKACWDDALLTLKDVMLWPLDQPLEIDPSIADADPDFTEGDLMPVGEMVDRSVSFLPKVVMARYRCEMARKEWRTVQYKLLPSLSLSGGWSTSYFTYEGINTAGFFSQFKGNRGEYIQLNLSIPIFGRLAGRSRVKQAKVAYRKAEIEYEQALRDVESDVERAVQDKTSARAAYIQARKRSRVQQEAYNLNKGRMARGLISPIEFQTASNSFFKSEAERLDAGLKYFLKKSIVTYYCGVNYLDQK